MTPNQRLATEPIVRQDAAESRFLAAYNRNKLDAAWIVTGPKGTGKGQLSLKIATFLLAGLDDTDAINVPVDHPVAIRIRAGSEPCLRIVRREDSGSGSRKSRIQVNDIRSLQEHFLLASPSGRPRIAIIDSADDLNLNAANALLKLLEEPPDNSFIFLTSSMPLRLLPTIRSRCRLLRCHPVPCDLMDWSQAGFETIPKDQQHALGVLARGSAGNLVRYHDVDGLIIYRRMLGMLDDCTTAPERQVLELAELCTSDPTQETFEVVQELFLVLVARLARFSATGELPDEITSGEHESLAVLAGRGGKAAGWASLYFELVEVINKAKLAQMEVFEVVNIIAYKIAGLARSIHE